MPTINERVRAAAETQASDALRQLARDKSPKVREAAAGNPRTPVDALIDLVQDGKWNVRFAVASNPNLLARDIALEATDKDVRGLAAQRADLDAVAYERVLRDPEHWVRECLASVATVPEIVAALARDSHPAVRATILHNPALSDADVEMLASDPIAAVRGSAASSRRPRAETLAHLVEDRSSAVRWEVLVHNPERLDLARKLLTDPDQTNRTQAEMQLENPRQFTRVLGDIELVE